MKVEITPSSFFAIVNQLNALGIAHEWKTVMRGDGEANRLFTQELVSDDWAGPGVVIHNNLLSDGTVKTAYQIEVVEASQASTTLADGVDAANTSKVLEVSTGNVEEFTMYQLGLDGNPLQDLPMSELCKALTPSKWSTYGYILWTGVTVATELEEKFPELVALLRFAKNKGFQYLKLDQDAVHLDGFPRFSW